MSQSVQNSKKCFKDIYKFFYDYLKLYKLASSSRVSCWKAADLRNALSWSSACEELTSKLAEKIQFYDVLLGEIDAILVYLHIECSKNLVVKKLIEEASIEMERAIFDNNSLGDELKCDLVSLLHNELYESSKEVQDSHDDSFTENAFKGASKVFKNEDGEDDYSDDFKKKPAATALTTAVSVVSTSPFQQKLTKFCDLLSRTSQNAELFDLFCVEHIKKHNDLFLLKELLQSLKRLHPDLYNACLIRLFDKKLLKLIKNLQSIDIFRFDTTVHSAAEDILLKAYFCYLVDFYGEMEQGELETTSRPVEVDNGDNEQGDDQFNDMNSFFDEPANMSDQPGPDNEKDEDDQFFADSIESQESSSSKFIVEHFKNALSQDKKSELSDILRRQERTCTSLFNRWTFLLDRLS